MADGLKNDTGEEIRLSTPPLTRILREGRRVLSAQGWFGFSNRYSWGRLQDLPLCIKTYVRFTEWKFAGLEEQSGRKGLP